eukprot:scaffold20221_cov71-Phaeocystis_antarctica.AAC.2
MPYPFLLSPCCASVAWPETVLDANQFFSYSLHAQADAQDFERLLMTEPLLTVRDLSVELKDDAGETELLRNYEFNISQGIVQRVSRFFDALALMDEAPPARGEGGKYADSARGGVMGFGRKRNVCNQEKSSQDAKVAALKAQVAELQVLLTTPSAALRPIFLCNLCAP